MAIFVKIFHAQVQPTAQYSAEKWGLDKNVSTEEVHLFFLNAKVSEGWLAHSE